MSNVVVLPYHQDERLGERSIPLPRGVEPAAVVEPELLVADQWQRLVVLCDVLAGEVAARVPDGPVQVLTGDCLSSVGTLAGLQRAGLDASIVWFDAHGDLHTVASSESGYLGGLPLRMVLGGDPELLGGPLGLNSLTVDQAVLVDGRDLDPAEEDFLATSALPRIPVDDVTAAVVPDGPILVHVDVDVIDDGDLPGLRFPVGGGPSQASVVAAVQRLLDSGRVAALEIACSWFEPDSDDDVQRRAALLAALLPDAGVSS